MDAPARDAQHLLQQWFDQFGDGMYGYIYTLVGNRADADDVVQSVFLALVRMGDKVHGIHYPKTYVYRAARHAALRVLAERQRQPQPLDELLFDPPDKSGGTPVDIEQLNWALRQLPKSDREVVMLKVYDEMTFREIAGVTRSLLPTIAARYWRALRKLRTLLEKCP